MSSAEKVFDDLRLEADSNARRNSHSLQDTNICSDGKLDQCDSRVRVLKGSDPSDWMADHNKAWNVNNDIKIGRSSTDEPNKFVTKNDNSDCEPEVEFENTSSHIEALHGERCPDDAYVSHTKNNEISYGRGGTQRKEADCAGITNISIEMFRYLTHQDLKRKSIEFNKEENVFVNKNSWADALRLREMRNEFILQKYMNLYGNFDLGIDEETREVATKVISTIKTLNKERAKLCDSNMYSDGARELWKQWVHEDNEVSEIESNLMRDLHLEALEEEWNNLPLCDKNRMSQLYDRIMNKSNVQNEQKLEGKIEDANNRQKQYMDYLVT